MTAPGRRLAAVAIAALLAAGCNNPFDPKADVELTDMTDNGNYTEVRVFQTDVPGGGQPLPLYLWAVRCQFVVKNLVGVNLTSVDITYTDLNGNEVTAYKTTGGRHFKFAYRLSPVSNNGSTDAGEGLYSTVTIYLVDRNVITELQSPAYPSDHFMFAAVTFRGEDDNGHDVKLTGRITIKYF